jgi:DNA-binding protein H-NS
MDQQFTEEYLKAVSPAPLTECGSSQAKTNELRGQLSRLGDEISSAKKRTSSLRGKKVAPKYRGPSGKTWAGRGAKPRWLVDATQGGKKMDDFLIDKGRRKRRAKR